MDWLVVITSTEIYSSSSIEGGLTKELSFNSEPTFYQCTVFRLHSLAAGPLTTALL